MLLFFGTLHAQILHRQINWTADTEDGYAKPLARFDNAYITENGLPIYQETIELEGSNKKISITNPVFETIGMALDNSYPELRAELTVSPVYVQSGEEKSALLEFIPLIIENQQYKKLVSFDIEIISSTEKSSSVQISQDWKAASVLAGGRWVKLKTSVRGIHKITYDQLQSWGFTVPSSVHLYGNGGYMLPKMNNEFYFDDLQQNAIFHGPDGQGKNCIFFYSTGTVKWNLNSTTGMFFQELNDYSDFAYYFLTDQGGEKIVGSAAQVAETPTHQVSTFNEHVYHELELENLIRSGRRWFGEKFMNGQTKSVALPLANIAGGQPVKIFIEAASRSGSGSSLGVTINNSGAAAIGFSPINTSDAISLYADLKNKTYELGSSPANINFSFKYSAANNLSYAWLDFITINYSRSLTVTDQLNFRELASVGGGNIAEFNLTATGTVLKIWDVTDYTNPVAVPFSKEGNTAKFKLRTDNLHELVAFYTDANLPQPEFVGEVENQNLHQLSGAAMVIVSHPDFLSEANELAQFHLENDQMNVEVITPLQIYNEFSGGAADVAGIRNFLKMLYDKDGSTLKYVLLFGDGSYDNKNVTGNANNFILTYQSPNSLEPTSSFVTDDFFVLLDDGEGEFTGLIDLGIGRIPAKTKTEAKTVLNKIKNYTGNNSLGNWRNVTCFIGDDEDNNIHMSQSDGLAQIVNGKNPAFYTDKIYLDAYQQQSTSAGQRYPDVNESIYNRVKEGALILNYTGHANETELAGEKILLVNDIDNWSNFNKLPIFVTATCEFSRFDDKENSGGEHILFNPNGGGIGLFSTTRVVYSTPNYVINKEFYEHVFDQDENGENLRMGDVLKRSKNGINTGINKRNFTLLADPALALAIPKYKVETETINGQPAGSAIEAISSMSIVTITGKITDHQGNVLDNFDGELIPVVYDKAYQVETLGNEGNTPFEFNMQNNIIYKGVATVTNGRFEFSFIVPKDISYSVGNGKIMYYANDGTTDAHGAFEDFLIGGPSSGSINDDEGPLIKLYLNDTSFKPGGEVGKNAVLIADIEDETGINTVGVGIGHDITAVLDGDYGNIMVLNDYYLNEKDSYKKGQVIFPLNGMSIGEHTLKIKVWDVLNNSTEVEIHFTVGEKLEIISVNAYPNPAEDYTNIIFTHNRLDETFDTQIEIFNFSGSLVDVFTQRLGSSGAESFPLLWQISDSQMLIRNGAYLYRIIIVAADGNTASKSGKLIISRY
jgi:hypothetical protein